MSNIISLSIENYRGIKKLDLSFPRDVNLICIIGRGDSSKTTILNALSILFCPIHSFSFSDYDFYNCSPKVNPILIEATLINFPEKLINEYKFGKYISGFSIQRHKLIDDVTDGDDLIPALTIKLIVDSNLEPHWFVKGIRNLDDISISAADRSLFQCHLVSDYIDKHFSWSKGSPLYSLLNIIESKDNTKGQGTIVLDAIRDAKEKIDSNTFSNFESTTNEIIRQAKDLGINIASSKTAIDFKDIAVKEGRVSLHDSMVPFRQMGKGTKRLASLAIQSLLVNDGGILLVDEIEQGLEPDRIKQVVNYLNSINKGQIFLTTHSRDAIVELGKKPLLLLVKNKKDDTIKHQFFESKGVDLQKAIRACPEAFFAKKIIVCEGATEIGICRAIDKWRCEHLKKPQMSILDCAYIDGTGNTLVQRVDEISDTGLDTALFCDSDLDTINSKKPEWEQKNIGIFDCDTGKCIEQQIFTDLPWHAVIQLLTFARNENPDSFNTCFTIKTEDDIGLWKESDKKRNTIVSTFTPQNDGKCKRDWFKGVSQGEFAGSIILDNYDKLDVNSKLRKTIQGLNEWIDKGI